MSKDHKEHAPEPVKVEKKLAPSEPMPATGCVVCGSYEGGLSQAAGNARWHRDCETARPDVIAKVKARA